MDIDFYDCVTNSSNKKNICNITAYKKNENDYTYLTI